MLWKRICLILAHLLVAILLVSSHPSQPDCYASYGQRIRNETYPCSLRRSNIIVPNISDWHPAKKEFQLNLRDPINGILSAKFPIPDTLLDFDVILLINESAKTEDECNKSHIHQMFSTHSKKLIHRDHCTLEDDGTCNSCPTVYLETEMRNIFTGCYMLKVAPRGMVNRYSQSTFIKSGYEKTFIQTPRMSYEYAPHKRNLVVQLPLNQLWNNHTRLTLFLLKSNCYNEVNKEMALVVELSPNITVQQCETNSPYHRHPECDSDAVGLSCRIFNVTPGKYCIRAQVLNDDRCDVNTVWTKESHSCLWMFNLVAGKEAASGEEREITPNGSTFNIYVGLGTAASIAICAGIIIHVIRHLRQHTPPDPKEPSYTATIFPKEKVLLLYALDCSLFMDLMATFRKILQKVSSWEVYDVFDPHQWGAIAKGRHEWVQRLLTEEDTMIVIVDSTSALLHQTALKNNYFINYFQPRPNSDLFTCALKAITNNVQMNVYKKIFVVRFNGFSEENQTIQDIAPLRRFLLPDHLHHLLSNLKGTSYLNHEDFSHEELQDTRELQKCLDSLIFYKAQNPEYLRSVLYRL